MNDEMQQAVRRTNEAIANITDQRDRDRVWHFLTTERIQAAQMATAYTKAITYDAMAYNATRAVMTPDDKLITSLTDPEAQRFLDALKADYDE